MYNRLHNYAILQLVNQIHNNFEQNNFTLEVFINLSKGFDTVDHNILNKKFEINGTVGKTLQWLKNYLNNRKQYIQINKEEKKNLSSPAELRRLQLPHFYAKKYYIYF